MQTPSTKQSSGHNAKTVLEEGQHVSRDAKTVLAEGQHASHNAKTMLAEEQHASHNAKTMLAEEQHVNRDAKTMLDAAATQLEGQVLNSIPELKTLPYLPVNTKPGQYQSGFTVKLELGRGGMGEVHLAHQHVLNRDVALKRPLGSESSVALMMEARLTGALEHPGIVPIHALGLDEAGQPVMVMKHVEGVSWADLIKDPHHDGWRRNKGDRIAWQLRIMSQVCDAVHYAHCQGVIHRDIKLDNIMIGRFGEVYLLDWGIAKRIQQTQGTGITGTLSYMAPEMAEGKDHAERTDVYLLGATLHHALIGQPRHNAETIPETLASVSVSAPYSYPSTVPAELARICNRAPLLTQTCVTRPPRRSGWHWTTLANIMRQWS